MPIYSGTTPTVTVKFYDDTRQPADPTTAVLTYRKPDGTVASTTSLTKVSTGVYTYGLSVDQAGSWTIEGKGTGTVESRDIGRFTALVGLS